MTKRLATLLASAALAACSSIAPEAAQPTFFVTRHAQKIDDGTRDPPLSAAGRMHAVSLAHQLRDAQLVAAYATPYLRTRQTAEPAAAMHRLAPVSYGADLPAIELVASLRSAHPQGAVLVVGHSNTVPQLVAALCSCTVAPLGDDNYGDLYRVVFDANGRAVLTMARF